tara:strand:- start:573 stop:818 length:246 start_codon:yes stop_codon:yes gene_type:complete
MDSTALSLITKNIELIGERFDLISQSIARLTKRIDALERDETDSEDVAVIKSAILEIQESISESPAKDFIHHALTSFNKGA